MSFIDWSFDYTDHNTYKAIKKKKAITEKDIDFAVEKILR